MIYFCFLSRYMSSCVDVFTDCAYLFIFAYLALPRVCALGRFVVVHAFLQIHRLIPTD
jgi:hypothetical protein